MRLWENRAWKKANIKSNIEKILNDWAEYGFDDEERTKPFSSGYGKGVFHQSWFEKELRNPPINEKYAKHADDYHFDFGSASKQKALAYLNEKLKPYKIKANVRYPEDDTGGDFVYFTTKSKRDLW